MASIIPYLDTRSMRKDGTYPIKIRITHGDYFFVATKIYVTQDQWDANTKKVKATNKQAAIYNQHILAKSVEIENAILKLDQTGSLKQMNSQELKNALTTGGKVTKKTKTFVEYFDAFALSRKAANTRATYAHTLQLIKKMSNSDRLRFDDINYTWLQEFEQAMRQGRITSKELSINSISIHLRNIRAVVNDAINNDLTTIYPFRKFKFKSEKTVKRSLSIDQLQSFRDYPCEKHEERYRDIFMLIFFLIGINLIDLLNLTEITTDGRVEYRRSKTGRLYSIKAPREAMIIIERYRGSRYLLDVLDDGKDYKNFFRRLNKTLKEIGVTTIGKHGAKEKNGIFPEISTYWARHTWATVAAGIEVPKETISAALGHGGDSVTDIYISFDQKKIDKANRKVIRATKTKINMRDLGLTNKNELPIIAVEGSS